MLLPAIKRPHGWVIFYRGHTHLLLHTMTHSPISVLKRVCTGPEEPFFWVKQAQTNISSCPTGAQPMPAEGSDWASCCELVGSGVPRTGVTRPFPQGCREPEASLTWATCFKRPLGYGRRESVSRPTGDPRQPLPRGQGAARGDITPHRRSSRPCRRDGV